MSILGKRLSTYLDLTEDEREAVEWLEARELRLKKGEVIQREGEPSDNMYIVKRGWLHASAQVPDGQRQILRLHYPGDLVGTSSIAWAESASTLTAVTEALVSPFPRGALARVFKRQPRLAGMLYAVAAAENVVLNDRLTTVGRCDALVRIATLLLEIAARLRTTEPSIDGRFEVPLSQVEIGDATGLTKVHVNRTLREMDEQGLIERDGRLVRIVDEPGLVALTGFKDRLREIATDWLPSAPAEQAVS